MIIILFASITYTLYFFIKYLKKDLDFVALRIDESGMFLCSKKNEDVFIPWEKIKFVIFVVDEYYYPFYRSKIIVRQHNKETHELFLRDYFNCTRPRNAIKAAYTYADNKNKIREVKDCLYETYESIMWRISKTEIKHEKVQIQKSE